MGDADEEGPCACCACDNPCGFCPCSEEFCKDGTDILWDACLKGWEWIILAVLFCGCLKKKKKDEKRVAKPKQDGSVGVRAESQPATRKAAPKGKAKQVRAHKLNVPAQEQMDDQERRKIEIARKMDQRNEERPPAYMESYYGKQKE